MTEPDVPDAFDSRSMRLARWWTERYTAGLPAQVAVRRRAEIDSDLAEHAHARHDEGWSSHAIARERLRRTVRGAASDVVWRREVMTGSGVGVSVQAVTGVASVLLGAYYLAFAWFLLGNTSVSAYSLMSGFEGYAEESGAVPAVIVASLGLALITTAVLRPVSAVVANAATIPVAQIAVMMFWFGVWPLGLVVCIGAIADLTTRASGSTRQP